MDDLKTRLITRLSPLLSDDDDDDIESFPQSPAPADTVPTNEAVDALTLHEATAGEINAWHIWREFYTLKNFLWETDWLLCHKLLYSGKIKVGLDRYRQRAIFAVDDTHYYTFDFDEKSGQPKNPAAAYRVLLKLNSVWEVKILRGMTGATD